MTGGPHQERREDGDVREVLAASRAEVLARASALSRSMEDIVSVSVSLRRLDAGEYGTCERCGAAIARERLLARPTARRCIDCAAGEAGTGQATRL